MSEVDQIAVNCLTDQVTSQAKKDKSKKALPFPLSKKAAFDLTTARNRNLINSEQQLLLSTTPVAFFGMSVGSHAALTWMMQSRTNVIKIVDPDTIDATNLNRLRFGWSQIGKLKVNAVAELLQDINPFARIIISPKTDPATTENIISKDPPVLAIVDEIDSFEAKIRLRQLAKKYRIPLVSAADIGDNIALDIERYDLSPQPEFFLGRVSGIDKINFSGLSDSEKKKLIIRLVGFEHNSVALLDSLLAIGGSVPTWPQLGATATISGGVIAATLKKIILGEPIKSGRYYLSLDDLLVDGCNSPVQTEVRSKKIAILKKLIGIK